jgi:hypothetical protein
MSQQSAVGRRQSRKDRGSSERNEPDAAAWAPSGPCRRTTPVAGMVYGETMSILRASFLLLLGGAVGCGPDVRESCIAACEKANECVEAPEEAEDCNATCDESVEAAEKTGCESEAAGLYDCVAAEGECGAGVGEEVCQPELQEVFACVIDYCLDNPGDEACFGGDG